jgi:hypothetical protein
MKIIGSTAPNARSLLAVEMNIIFCSSIIKLSKKVKLIPSTLCHFNNFFYIADYYYQQV